MDQTTSKADGIQKVAQLLRGIRFAMLTTTGADGGLYSRPMTTLERDFDGDLWFFTSRETTTVGDVQRNPQVNVAYANPGKNDWVSVRGQASLVEDQAKKRELWSDALKAFFPEGVDDPQLVLLKISATGAEYWDGAGKLTTLLGLARAAITGKAATDLGDSGKVEL